MKRTSKTELETAIEAVLLGEGYTRVDVRGFDRERAILPHEAVDFIRATQAKLWERLEALHGETGEREVRSLRLSANRRATLLTVAVTGQIPLEEMSG